MNLLQKPRQHFAWRPRINSDHEFNSFVRSSGSEATVDMHTLNDSEEVTHESGVREDGGEPIKIGPS
jgi:hypothetical protein